MIRTSWIFIEDWRSSISEEGETDRAVLAKSQEKSAKEIQSKEDRNHFLRKPDIGRC